MKATSLGHRKLPKGHEEIHHFCFELQGGGAPEREKISLRTARVIVSRLENWNALKQRLRPIVPTEPDGYEDLPGRSFKTRSSAMAHASGYETYAPHWPSENSRSSPRIIVA
jgi:hypothetical protein